jgi:hypothetical protein
MLRGKSRTSDKLLREKEEQNKTELKRNINGVG